MKRTILSLTGIAILAVILVLLNSLSRILFSGWYVDLTDEGLYSLSPGTKNVLAKLEEPITLRYYYSKTEGKKYPAIKLYGERIENLLREYDRVGGDKLILEVHDPRPDSEEEEWAQKYGLSSLSGMAGEKLFLGLAAVNSLGEEKTIALFNIARQDYLEYDVTKLVYKLSFAKKPVVGIVSSLDVAGTKTQAPPNQFGRPPQQAPWFFIEHMRDLADVRFFEGDLKGLDKSIDILMVIHPKELSEAALYAVDQYVLGGGKLFLAVDPYCQSDEPAPNPENPYAAQAAERSSDLNKLLSAWGIELEKGKIAADINMSTPVSQNVGGMPARKDFPLWLSVRNLEKFGAKQIDKSNVITSALENALLAWAGRLVLKQSIEGVTVEPLLKTSPEAMLLNESEVRGDGGDPDRILRSYVRGTEELVLAAYVHGKFKSSFAAAPAGSSQDKHLSESSESSNVVVIADVDFLSDRFSVAKQNIFGASLVSLLNDNQNFVQNVVEYLSGSSDLIGLRSRGRFSRPFTKVQEIEQRAEERWKDEEKLLEAKLNGANQRLQQLQSSGGGADKQVFTKELMREINKFREEKLEAQKRLREVRRNLRQDKERLGNVLFFINTFGVPLLLILGSLVFHELKRRRSRLVQVKNNE